MAIRVLLIAATSILLGWIPNAYTTEIPVEILFQRPSYGAMRLSPDGMHLAAVVRRKGRNNLAVVDLEKRETKAITDFDDGDIVQFSWINNNRLLYATGDAEEASGKARFYAWFAVDRDGSRWNRLPGFTRLLGTAPGGADSVLVAARWRSPVGDDVYSLDTYSGRGTLLSYDHPDNVVDWVVDRAGVPRVAHAYQKGIHSLWYRESDNSSWTKIDEGKDFQLKLTPLAFDYDNRTLYVSARHDGDKQAIYTFDFQAKKLGELVAGSSQTDMGAPIFSHAKRALVGVNYQADLPGVVWMDRDLARLQKTTDQALPNTFNMLLIADQNPRRAVVFASSDTNSGTIYLLDTEKSTLQLLAVTRPWLDSKDLAERKPVRYAARDGLEISAYLTRPNGQGDRKPPLVVHIHGGPYVRGFVGGFALEAQFFASRGYAVLEPEFRGSDGHGWKLLSAGFKQWGLSMQDDITDGVEWLIKQGIVDRDRICLYGGSYGGYAALWGLIKTPDLYKCGVAFVAVTDLQFLFDRSWLDANWSPFLYYGAKDIIGDPELDAEKFKSVSPVENASRIKAPVLLAFGGSDLRVPIKHGNRLRDALDLHSKTYEWVVYPEEGHGFNKDENRFDFYRRVDAFLKKYLH